MPCGGINPIVRDVVPAKGGKCWVCRKPGALHFVDEWDDFIHARCVPEFLQSEEGRVVIDHGHTVYLRFDLEASSGV
jgi:hypothetical protein